MHRGQLIQSTCQFIDNGNTTTGQPFGVVVFVRIVLVVGVVVVDVAGVSVFDNER